MNRQILLLLPLILLGCVTPQKDIPVTVTPSHLITCDYYDTIYEGKLSENERLIQSDLETLETCTARTNTLIEELRSLEAQLSEPIITDRLTCGTPPFNSDEILAKATPENLIALNETNIECRNLHMTYRQQLKEINDV